MRTSVSASNRIIVKNFEGESATIDGTGISIPSTGTDKAMFEIRASNVTIDGIKVINSIIYGGVQRDDGIWANRGGSQCISVLGPNIKNVTIRNCYTNNCLSSGISVWGNTGKGDFTGATNIIIEKNEVVSAVINGWDEHITIASGVDQYVVRNNIIHEGGHIGCIGIDSKVTVRNGKVYSNTIYNLLSNGIYVDGWNDLCYNIEIYNNIIYNVGSGLTVGAEQGGTVHDIVFYNNLVYNSRYNGIQISGSTTSNPSNIHHVCIYNNTIHGNGYGSIVIYGNTPALVIKNNIFSKNKFNNGAYIYPSNEANITMDRNVVYSHVGRSWTDPVQKEIDGTNAIPGDPMFVNAILGSENFRLQSMSPAIGKGTVIISNSPVLISSPTTDLDGNFRNTLNSCDIGAYEFGTFSSVAEEKNSDLRIFPNPAKDELNILGCQVNTKYKVFNINGVQILQGQAIDQYETIDIRGLKSGMYLLQLKNSAMSTVKHFIKL
jgi:hypothetical protein